MLFLASLAAIALASKHAAPTPPPIVRVQAPPALVITPTPKPTGVRPYKIVGKWRIMIDDTLGKGCFLYRFYPDQTELRVGVMPASGGYSIFLGNPDWKSLEKSKDYAITMKFDDQSPWTGNASGFIFPESTQVYLALTTPKSDFIADLATRQSLVAMWNGRTIASLPLDGSSEATTALIDCQTAIEAKRDPFATKPESPGSTDPFAT